jgi:hypothetical protein
MLIFLHLSAFSGGRKAASMRGRGSHSARALRSFPEVIGFTATSDLLLRRIPREATGSVVAVQ